jgi:FkbM family methyltransferase
LYIDLNKIASRFNEHASTTDFFKASKIKFEKEVRSYYKSGRYQFQMGDRAKKFSLPYISQGNIDSADLFGMNELILFSYYEQTIGNKYRKILDLGANIGLHTVFMALLGASVTSVEADPLTFQLLTDNVKSELQNINVKLINAAVCTEDQDSIIFLRVLQNRTGSHVLGARQSLPYGGYEEILVQGLALKELLIEGYDLVKIDVEGSEADLISSFELDIFPETSYLIEIGSAKNARKIWNHVKQSNFNLFAQKNGWKQVYDSSDLPIHHSEGTLFITTDEVMRWGIQ